MKGIGNIQKLRILTILWIFLSCLTIQAADTVYEQLCQLNKEWHKYNLDESVLSQHITFDSHEDLIQVHLNLVEKILRSKDVSYLSPTQQQKRQEGLDILKDYYQEALFPKNTRHSITIPYFIDDFNTACAVGHIMRESGEVALAHQIAEEKNNAYIKDLLHYEKLGEWAVTMGFEVDELAWIQPAYGPNVLLTLNLTEPNCGDNDGSIIVESIEFTEWWGEPFDVDELIWTWFEKDELNDWIPLSGNPNSLEAITAGHYAIDLQHDSNGFFHFEPIYLNNIDAVEVNAEVTNETCYGMMDGSITLDIIGGEPPYTIQSFDLQGNDMGSFSTDDTYTLGDLEGISYYDSYFPGYQINITDDNGCISFHHFNIFSGEAVFASFDTYDACEGNDGHIEVYTYGGINFDFEWSNGSTEQNQSDLAPGDYTVTITSDTGCSVEYEITIGDCAEPCEDLTWLDEWVFNPGCCYNAIYQYESPDLGTVFYVQADFDFCEVDGPLVSYLLDCEGSVICEDHSLWTGENACDVYNFGESVELIWLSDCWGIIDICHASFSYEPEEEGSITFTDTSPILNNEVVQWEWQLDGNTVSTDSTFELNGLLLEIYDVCLTITTDEGCSDTYCININMSEFFGCTDPNLITETGCDDVYDPVCGCNGITYQNECTATNWYGITEWTEGECESQNECTFNPSIEVIFEECYGTEDEPQSFATAVYSFQAYSNGGDFLTWGFSNLWSEDLENDFIESVEFITIQDGEPVTEPYEVCLTVGDIGLECYETVCIDLFPETMCDPNTPCIDEDLLDPAIDCADVLEPVCGCDGVTYENECVAQYYFGVSEFTQGPCETSCEVFYEYWMNPLESLELCLDYCEIDEVETLDFTLEVGFNNCSLSDDGKCLIFAPIPGFSGDDIIYVSACDSEGNCMEVEVLVHVGVIVTDDYFLMAGSDILAGEVLSNDNLPEFWELTDYNQPAFGTLDFDLASGIFTYIPDENFEGIDSFTYTACENGDLSSNNCMTASVFIEVYDITVTPDEPATTLEADEIFASEGEQLTFCVLENDFIDSDDYTVTFGDEDSFGIEEDEDGCFTLIGDLPPGTYEMTYTVCEGEEEDQECNESIVTIIIYAAEEIDAEDDYEVSDLNTEIIIEPLANDIISTQFGDQVIVITIITEPENGTVSILEDVDCESPPCQFFLYEPNLNFEGQDQFTYQICVGDLCDEAVVYIEVGTDCSEFCVWPGDTNNDGIANNLDLLPIGQYYNEMGPIREDATIEWQAQPATNWETFTTNEAENAVNLKMIDCDGNGIIDEADLSAIYANYGKGHGKMEEEVVEGNPTIRLEIEDETVEAGNWINVDVILENTDEVPLEDIYGIAFQIDYFNEIDGETVIPADSIQMQFDDSWFNGDGEDFTLGLFQNLHEMDGSSRADVAYVRTNQIGANGSGDILSMSCFITANITGKTQGTFPIYFHVTNAQMILADGEQKTLNISESMTSTEVEFVETTLPTTLTKDFEVYPNPTNDYLQIELGNQQVKQLSLYNNMGQLVKFDDAIATQNLTWDIQNIPVGIYILSIESPDGITHKKIQIVR